MSSRREFIRNSSIASAGMLLLPSCHTTAEQSFPVSKDLQREMYDKALSIAKSKIRGGEHDPVYKKPFVDAAFSSNIFYWDTCFIACYAKYHQDELPVINALDNFYNRIEPDGFICREYTKEGQPMWPKEHPVSVNPPLLGFAELELYSEHRNKSRLQNVYPLLKKHFEFWEKNFKGDDGLYFNDALGSGMDNIERFPPGWKDDGKGIPMRNLHPEIFSYGGLDAAWNRQGRMVDTSAQMALFAMNMIRMAELAGKKNDIDVYRASYDRIKSAINSLCWNDTDGFYCDLAYGRQLKRKHIGMFWTLIAGLVPVEKLKAFLSHLLNPAEFWRKVPVATLSADEKDFSPAGDYWKGSIWAPTNYMVIRGLLHYRQEATARDLARRYYTAVAEVYKKTGTFWENYAPDTFDKGNNSRPDFCGWTGIVPITIQREFLR